MVNQHPTLEEFARKHRIPQRWLELREACNRLLARPDFWYRRDLRNEARLLAVEASEILQAVLKQETCATARSNAYNPAKGASCDFSIVGE